MGSFDGAVFAMKRQYLLVVVALALVAAACGDDDAGEAPAASTTAGPAPTTEAPAPTTAAPGGAAEFAIVSVTLAEDAQGVVIQNVGGALGNLSGLWLCQAPSYDSFGDVELAPGEMVAVTLGGDFTGPEGAKTASLSIGSIGVDDGEIGLYTSRDFGSSSAIVDYVEWGEGGHTRSSVAVEAGIWNSGDFVPTTDTTTEITANGQVNSAAGWSSG